MKNWLSKSPEETNPKRKSNAYRIALILIAVLVVFDIFSTLNYVSNIETVSLFYAMLLSYAATLATLSCIWLIYQSRVTQAVWGLIIITLIALFLSPLLGSGLGLIYGVSAIVITTVIAGQGLEARHIVPANITGFTFGFATYLLDISLPVSETANQNAGVTSIVLIVLLGILTVIVIREFQNFSLRTKFTVTFVSISLVIVTVLGWQSTLITRNNLTEQAFLDITETARNAAENIDLILDNQLNVIRTEAQIIDLADYLSLPQRGRNESIEESRAFNVLQALSRKDPIYISSYALLDRNGIDLLDTFQDDEGINKSDRDYFITPFETGLPYISPIRISQTTSEPSIYFSAPVRNTNGEIIGILRVRYNAAFIQNLLIDSTSGNHEEEYAVLVDNETFVRLAHTGDTTLTYKSYQDLTFEEIQVQQENLRLPLGLPEEVVASQTEIIDGILALEEQPIFTAPSIYENAPAYTGGVKLNNVDWTVIVQRTERATTAPIQDQTRSITLSALLIIMLAAGLGALVSQFLSRPLAQLSDVAGEIANGNLAVRARQETNDEIGALAKSFNYMAEQLYQTLSSLEQRVADRTRALAIATEVSRRLSTILDEKQLVTEVVEQVQNAYNYYHGQIYLLDESGKTLVLAGATGEGGKALLDKKHSLSIEQGLVGRSARTKTAVLVPDTSKDPEWLPNPLLPDTKAEIAIPILLGETLVGVLDMQDDVVGDIFPEDIEYLTAIANQTAIALQNARSLTQAQKKAEREALIASIGQKIQQEATAESAMKVAIREVGRALGTGTVIKLTTRKSE